MLSYDIDVQRTALQGIIALPVEFNSDFVHLKVTPVDADEEKKKQAFRQLKGIIGHKVNRELMREERLNREAID